MRWLKWGLVAGWVGVHLVLWNDLPLMPRIVLPTEGYDSYLQIVGFTADGTELVAGNDARVRVWDAVDGRLKADWPMPSRPFDTRYFSPDRRSVLGIDYSGDVPTLLNLTTGELTKLPPIGKALNHKLAAWNFAWLRVQPAFAPDGGTLAYVAGKPETGTFVLRIWDLAAGSGSEIELEGLGLSPVFAPDGRSLAVWTEGNERVPPYVRLIDPTNGRDLARLETQPAELVRVLFSPDGQTLAVHGGFPNTTIWTFCWLELWDVRSRRMLRTFRDTSPAGWTADGRLVGQEFQGVRTYDRGSEIERPLWDTPDMTQRGFLYGTSTDRTLGLLRVDHPPPAWHVWIGQKVRLPDRLRAHTTQSIRLYDTQTGREQAVVWAWTDQPALTSDGKTLATLKRGEQGREDTIITLWDIPPRKPGGIILALMIAEVGLAITWTAWRRRRARRLRCAAR